MPPKVNDKIVFDANSTATKCLWKRSEEAVTLQQKLPCHLLQARPTQNYRPHLCRTIFYFVQVLKHVFATGVRYRTTSLLRFLTLVSRKIRYVNCGLLLWMRIECPIKTLGKDMYLFPMSLTFLFSLFEHIFFKNFRLCFIVYTFNFT